ncbi:MAG: glycosyltransferase [Actinobacteria bacterium]|nr:MAG: glycosyltransferase [Actinomycetota bacterium]
MRDGRRWPLAIPGAPAKVSAIATAYHPDPRLLEVLAAAREACCEVVVVDNTPGGSALLRGEAPDQQVRVLRPGRNLGLAGALNLGLRGVSPDSDAVLLLDQDSVLAAGDVRKLATHLADSTVGVAAPAPWDVARSSFIDPRTALRRQIADRDAVITSGMVVRKSLMDELGGFREDFFVDCVDQDFCLRVRRAGKRIVQDKRVLLPHSLGALAEHRFLIGHVRTTHHPPWRLYWVIRNGTVLLRENWRLAPAWCLAWGLIMLRWMLLTALYERPRGARLLAMWRGLLDGVRGQRNAHYLPETARELDGGGLREHKR